MSPLDVLAGDVRNVGWRSRWSNITPHRELLERAADAHDQRRYGEPILIHTRRLGDGWVNVRSTPPPEQHEPSTYDDDDDYQATEGRAHRIRPGRIHPQRRLRSRAGR